MHEPQVLTSGTEKYGVSWKTMIDDHFDLEDFKNFTIIATPGTTRYLGVDHVAEGNDDLDIIIRREGIVHYEPLYLFAHSGISVSLSPFGDKWDSGQCGFAAFTAEQARGSLPSEYSTMLKAEVDQFNAAINGGVVGYIIERSKYCRSCGQTTSEIVDSCWGYLAMDGYVRFEEEEVLPIVRQIVEDINETEGGQDVPQPDSI